MYINARSKLKHVRDPFPLESTAKLVFPEHNHVTHSGIRRLLGSNLENELLVWADSARNKIMYD
jgi:hypothetical protein